MTSPRVQQLNGTMYRKLGLDPAGLDRAAEVIVDALVGGAALTRAELGQRLGTSSLTLGLPGDERRAGGLDRQRAVARGPAHLRPDGRTSPGRKSAATGDLAELAYRFFVGHGPASVRDLARWASLTQTQAAEATEAAAPRLAALTVAGEPLWFDPAAPEPPADVAYGALLLPLYDELTLTYPALGFPTAAGTRTRRARTCSSARWCWATRTSAPGGVRSGAARCKSRWHWPPAARRLSGMR